jgi:hypothetical protein
MRHVVSGVAMPYSISSSAWANFIKRLEIYTTIPATPLILDIIIKILVELLSVLALATEQIKDGRFSKCAVTYTFPVAQCTTENFSPPEIGSLTQDEARMTVDLVGFDGLCARLTSFGALFLRAFEVC